MRCVCSSDSCVTLGFGVGATMILTISLNAGFSCSVDFEEFGDVCCFRVGLSVHLHCCWFNVELFCFILICEFAWMCFAWGFACDVVGDCGSFRAVGC